MSRLPAGLFTVLVVLTVTGCTFSDTTYDDYFKILKQSFASSFGDGGVTREQAAAVPYASLGYRLNNSREALLVLATDINGEQTWTSRSHVVIVTQQGHVKRTVGLAHNIVLTPARGSALTPPTDALKASVTSALLVDIPDMGIYSAQMRCVLQLRGYETVIILAQPIATARIEETCESGQIDWRFSNSYWIDPKSGFVWRSVQHIDPRGDTLQTNILRPPT